LQQPLGAPDFRAFAQKIVTTPNVRAVYERLAAKMTEILTSAQMRAIEKAAIESGSVTGLDLMERAGRGVVEAILAQWPDLALGAPRAVVLCGPGNNGGDGFVVARFLKARGWGVEVLLYGDPGRLPADARVNHDLWKSAATIAPLSATTWEASRFPQHCDLVVDALFGLGLTRPTDLRLCALSSKAELGQTHRVVAIDLPSGLCGDSGRIIGPESGAVSADLTVTFHTLKPGHVLGLGPDLCGRVKIVDIGLREVSTDFSPGLIHLEVGLAVPPKLSGHKYSHGHALILSGPAGHGGATRLAARGALRIGAGLVTLGCPPAAMPENAARLDAVMLRDIADGLALAGMLQDRRINAVCIGPALGLDARGKDLVTVALDVTPGHPPPPSPPHGGEGGHQGQPSRADGNERALPLPPVGRGWGAVYQGKRPVVLDADALTLLSQYPELFAALHGGCVLTPHAGEFARLFPDIAAQLTTPAAKGPGFSKVDATRIAAARAGCVVLFKGADTVIADPTGRASIHSAAYDRAAPWLATAGAGDVLAGFITGLMARGLAPFDAACTAAWLHVEAARAFGPGLIAEDLPDQLPGVFRALGL
jgi:ADP-dependent NAD(P)H-hydrate dehydratase / NAD(P)H-hydrate epimerase